jgi:hydroxymethylpyrimidine/phosphomethylpyrimidine kinase
MVAKGGHALMEGKAVGGVIAKLLPVARVVTPNIPEAEVLSGLRIRSIDDMKKAAAVIRGFGVQNVVIKGGHLALGRKIGSVDILYDGKDYHEFTADWIKTKNTHGTGCTFAAALAAYLARGSDMPDAVVAAKSLVTEAIRGSLQIGKGHGPVSAGVKLINTNVRDECLNELQKAFFSLAASNFATLVPEVASNLVYARPGARNEEDVAGFPGRIFRFCDSVCVVSEPAYGASQHMANVVLTVLKKNPDCRCAMNIKYTERIIDICRENGLEVCFFDRADEQTDKKNKDGCTLKWGVHQVLERTGKIPDIIFDRGSQGKEPMVRVLGENPANVVGKVLAILKNLNKGES